MKIFTSKSLINLSATISMSLAAYIVAKFVLTLILN